MVTESSTTYVIYSSVFSPFGAYRTGIPVHSNVGIFANETGIPVSEPIPGHLLVTSQVT